MQKRGLSEVISTVLIILIVIVSIGIIWSFIYPSITKSLGTGSSNEESTVSRLINCLDLQLRVESCESESNGNYTILVRMGAKYAGNLSEIKFIFKTENDEFIISRTDNLPSQLEFRYFEFNLTDYTSDPIISVDVAGILENGNVCDFSGLPASCYQTILDDDDEDEEDEEYEKLTTYAYSWAGNQRENIIPMFSLRTWHNVTNALTGTASQPEEHKTILDMKLYLGINTNESDRCQDPISGNWSDCIWWNNGMEAVRQAYNSFFQDYKNQGGELDYLILDSETGLSNWAIGSNLANQQQLERWRAIQNDPRNTTLFQELQARGFQGEDLIGTVYNFLNGGDNYLIWNSYMEERVANYYKNATYNVVKTYYPNVKSSNYGFSYQRQYYTVPDSNGHKIYKTGNGTHIGTHQTQGGLYGQLGQITNPNRLIQGFTYQKTPFNAMRYEVNRMRVMELSDQTPIQPWVSHKGWDQSLIKNNDYYEELIIHLALTGTDSFLYWNPTTIINPSTEGNDTLFSNLMREVDQFSGYENKQSINSHYSQFTNGTWWISDYVLSGSIAADKKVWRFTPDLINGSYNLISSNNPVIFKTINYTITIPNGEIKQNNFSTIGIWIIQPETAPNPDIELN